MASEVRFLLDIGLLLLAALMFSLVFARLRLPVVVGQILAGIVVGPYGLRLVRELNTLNLLASLGIVLLLFVIGLEMDPRVLLRVGTRLLAFAAVEFGLSWSAGMAVGLLLGWGWLQSLFLASLLAITSTAVVGKILLERGMLRGEEGHLLVGLMIVEDVIAVALLLILPSLATAGVVPFADVISLPLKGLVLFLTILAFGVLVAPHVIDFITQFELEFSEVTFLLSLATGLLFAVLAAFLGFSPAIGAFLTGLLIMGKQSKFLSAKVAPIKDLFIILFFVSMGTLMDLSSLGQIALPAVAILAVGICAKFAGGWVGSSIIGLRRSRTDFATVLVPRGEFSLILASEGVRVGVFAPFLFSMTGILVLTTSVIAALGLRIGLPRTAMAEYRVAARRDAA